MELEILRIRLLAVRAIARATSAGPEPPVHAALQTERTAVDDRLEEVSRALADGDSARGLGYLLGLRPDELSFLWATVAATVDPELAIHLPQLGPRYGRTGISLAQFCSMVELGSARSVQLGLDLLSSNPLIRHHLVEPIDPRAITMETAWVATPRVVAFLSGTDAIDPLVEQVGGLVAVPTEPISDDVLDELRARIGELAAGQPCAILIQGRRAGGRRTLAASAVGCPVVAIDLERLRYSTGLGETLAGLAREVLLRGALPLIAGADELVGAEATQRRREVARFIEASPGPVFVITSTTLSQLEVSRPVFRFELPLPSPRTRAAMWRRELGGASIDEAIARVAHRFQLGPGGIRDAVIAARANATARREPIGEIDLIQGLHSTVEERFGGFARRHTTHLTWADVVLVPEIRDQIDQLVSRVRDSYQVLDQWGFQRHLPGSGVAALFSGPPGTGKTMLAAVMARALGLELFRVDLSQITSKWVGETEKQLDRVFDAAETGHAMLLFDEADSLFAKRTEVKGATERYANLEVNFLLQRIETFSGVAVLTTNMDGSLDPAFRRRLAAHIRFPHPDRQERAELWRRLLPSAAPVARDLDFERLASDFPAFAGAQIRNALTTAAFLAARSGCAIDQALLRRAASEETHAMGRIVTARQS
ncbi:MAG: ATP-binding protein [Kofleriaceae bacterium]